MRLSMVLILVMAGAAFAGDAALILEPGQTILTEANGGILTTGSVTTSSYAVGKTNKVLLEVYRATTLADGKELVVEPLWTGDTNLAGYGVPLRPTDSQTITWSDPKNVALEFTARGGAQTVQFRFWHTDTGTVTVSARAKGQNR